MIYACDKMSTSKENEEVECILHIQPQHITKDISVIESLVFLSRKLSDGTRRTLLIDGIRDRPVKINRIKEWMLNKGPHVMSNPTEPDVESGSIRVVVHLERSREQAVGWGKKYGITKVTTDTKTYDIQRKHFFSSSNDPVMVNITNDIISILKTTHANLDIQEIPDATPESDPTGLPDPSPTPTVNSLVNLTRESAEKSFSFSNKVMNAVAANERVNEQDIEDAIASAQEATMKANEAVLLATPDKQEFIDSAVSLARKATAQAEEARNAGTPNASGGVEGGSYRRRRRYRRHPKHRTARRPRDETYENLYNRLFKV